MNLKEDVQRGSVLWLLYRRVCALREVVDYALSVLAILSPSEEQQADLASVRATMEFVRGELETTIETIASLLSTGSGPPEN